MKQQVLAVWRRLFGRGRHLPSSLPPPFCYAQDIEAVRAALTGVGSVVASVPPGADSLPGHCYVCEMDVNFTIETPDADEAVNFRETLRCPQCGLINRWRGCLHLFESICHPTSQSRIYLTEALSPVYQNLARRFPMLSGSEYLPGHDYGATVPVAGTEVRNEDITRLTFADNSFTSILCMDVLEHVPAYRSALREFSRVLTRGGRLVLSVPFSFRHETVVRAVIGDDAQVRHLQKPCYHGDPLSPDGVLSFYDFGMALLDEMKAAGFREVSLVCYYSKKWGYLNENVAFVGCN